MSIVSLIYTYDLKNSGDMAINLGAFDLLQDLNFKIKAFSKSNENDKEFQKSKAYINEYYPKIKFYGGPFKLNRDDNKMVTVLNHFNGYLKTIGINEDNYFINELTSSNLIIFNGGNLFRAESFADYARLLALMYPLKKAREKKIPFIIFPQSASNINRLGHKLLNKNLEQAKRVFTREDKSYHYLKETFSNLKMEKSIDLAFFIKDNNRAKEKYKDRYSKFFNLRSKKIAITLRTQVVGDLGELGETKKNKIMKVIKKTIEHYLEMENTQLTLIIQTRKDKVITEQIYNKYKHTSKVTLIEEYDCLVLREIYRNCDLLIGMRLHSIIMALSTYTPAVGFFDEDWGLKNPGLMQKFKLPYKFVEDEVTDLVNECDFVINNKNEIKIRIKDTVEKETERIKFSLNELITTENLTAVYKAF
ncbi:polysaccharide pyruvyl transferase family protein [Heliorestis convoluta]|uniref:Polysaccharide pyruvyl transferase family protein n=1 Tax=Heliorestis convoluta TaxID=356322 RepID=A0A5Q2MXA3_9FIRM|nr:polysaccharide pyruvyl transferase family protein [Heliorestis convoluta]QGG47304.1 polysaccharide pyruvyl transferase family protein [Heliorestis convoluta]